MFSPAVSRTVRIFYSYATTASRDKFLLKKIREHLSLSRRQGLIDDSYDSEKAIKSIVERPDDIPSLNEVDIIVLLVSPAYFDSDRCFHIEMQRALEREKAGEAHLIPVLLYPTEWQKSPLRSYAILPSGDRPVKRQSSTDTDNALEEVRQGILKVVEKLTGSRLPSEKRVFLNTIPYGHSRFFTDREDILSEIHTYFTSAQAFQQTPVLALSGMLGCGKTQIAVEYAYRHKNEYQATLWLDASSQQSLKEAIVQWAEELSFLQQDRVDEQHLFSAFKRWLQQHERWLLILDGLRDLQLMNLIIPSQPSGHVLLTTYSRATGDLAYCVHVERMAPEESALFLLRRARVIEEQALHEEASATAYAEAVRIVQEFDGLALALDQAGAYIEETRCGLAGYLELYREQCPVLLARRGELVRTHPDSVMATLLLLFRAVAQEYPAAQELLYLLAFLHPDSIPREMIRQGASALDYPLRSFATDADALNEAIAVLLKYSLVQYHTEDTTLLSIHRVVQTILIEGLMPKEQHRWAGKAVRLMNRVFPEPDFENWPVCEKYFLQARACAENILRYQLRLKEAAHLLQHLGDYCYQRAYYQDAERYLTAAFNRHRQAKEADLPALAVTLNSLALLYHRQGKYQNAKVLYQEALEVRERVYGPVHESIAQTLNNLASLYADLGKYQEAEVLYERALPIYQHTVGPDHPDTATALYNLAMLYEEQGKFSQAKPLYQQAFSIEECVLEADHPHLALNLVTRAAQCKEQGHYTEAEELYQQALAIQMHALGPDHLETARSLSGLADLYTAQQRYQEAEALYRQALTADEKVLGCEHPETATILYNLGYVCCQQERYQEAEQIYRQSLAVYEKALGSEHPDLAAVLHDLGSLYHLLGKDEQAEPFLRRGLAIREHTLDPEHIDIAHSLGALVDLLFQQHLDEQAEPLYQRFLNIIRREYGPESSEVAEAQEEYALLLERINEQRKAGFPTDDALQQKMSESTPNDP